MRSPSIRPLFPAAPETSQSYLPPLPGAPQPAVYGPHYYEPGGAGAGGRAPYPLPPLERRGNQLRLPPLKVIEKHPRSALPQTPSEKRMPEKKKEDIPVPEESAGVKEYAALLTPFIYKLFVLVTDQKTNYLITWTESGDSFIVHDPERLAHLVLPNYFKHRQFASFVRQLNKYRFHKLTTERWIFGHDKFKRDRPDLLVEIGRQRSPDRPAQARAAARIAAATAAATATTAATAASVAASVAAVADHPVVVASPAAQQGLPSALVPHPGGGARSPRATSPRGRAARDPGSPDGNEMLGRELDEMRRDYWNLLSRLSDLEALLGRQTQALQSRVNDLEIRMDQILTFQERVKDTLFRQ